MRHIIRPLDKWPFPDTENRRSGGVFKTKWSGTLKLLYAEAGHLGAEQVVIQVVTTEAELRQDGGLRAQGRVHHPGAMVLLETSRGPMRFASDAHESRYYGDQPEWQMNVHGIALGLAALRAVDRYGITGSGQQYTGWLQIESGAIALPAGMTKDQAAVVIGELAGWRTPPDWMDPEVVKLAYRKAARTHHPDAGGDRVAWDRLETAYRTIFGGDS